MTDRLFKQENYNADVMVVPQQEGGSEEDAYFGSIGDATMQHVGHLNDFERQMWEELVLMPSGDLFRMIPSFEDTDKDPFHLRGMDLEEYLKKFRGKCSDSELEVIKEAIQVEEERRAKVEESEDALDQEILSYEEWEDNPGFWSKRDIPVTPKNKAIYVGNTRQMFYDYFPEGHPDAKVINQFLGMMNRPWETGMDENYAEFVVELLEATHMKKYTRHWLTKLAYAIAKDNDMANTYAKVVLRKIDNCWAEEYKQQAIDRTLAQPMTHLFMKKEAEWEELSKKGANIAPHIKAFGQMLFQEFRNEMTSFHWSRYRSLKDKYAPKLMIKGVDINRCALIDLQRTLRMTREDAENVWFARPFMSLEEAHTKGFIDGVCFSDSEVMDKVVSYLENQADKSVEEKSLSRLNEVRRILFSYQQLKKVNLSTSEWGQLWRYYRILKNAVTQEVNNDSKAA